MLSKYDVVIIGSGIGGLTCGYILSKKGYKLAIFEQSAQIGGCLQTFKRGGTSFDTGLHYVGNMNEGQILHNLFDQLSLFPHVETAPLDPLGFDVISFRGEKYRFAAGYDNFANTLAQNFPAERDNLKRYTEALKKLYQKNIAYKNTSVNDLVSSFTSNEILQNVLVGTIPLYNGVKDKTPAYIHAVVNDSNIQGACRIVGGSDKIVNSLVRSIRSFGGDVFASSKVCKIMCNNSKATCISLENGTRIATDYVISSTHPEITINMLDSHLLRPMYKNRIRQMEQSISNFSVYLKFRKNTVPYMNNNYYHYNGDEIWNGEKYTEQDWPRGYLYTHLCHASKAEYAEAGKILAIMRYDDVEQWTHTKTGRRGDAYREFKRRKAEKLLEQLERDFPGTRAKIEDYHCSSPLTYRDFTGTIRGSMYGVARDINTQPILHRTKIPNLLLAGQNINAHGIEGTIIGAFITCSELGGSD